MLQLMTRIENEQCEHALRFCFSRRHLAYGMRDATNDLQIILFNRLFVPLSAASVIDGWHQNHIRIRVSSISVATAQGSGVQLPWKIKRQFLKWLIQTMNKNEAPWNTTTACTLSIGIFK